MSKRPHTFKNLVVEDGAVSEGTAKITVPKGEVFYNPVQQFNRDLSISVISAFQKMYLGEAKLKKRFPVSTLPYMSLTYHARIKPESILWKLFLQLA